MVRILSVAVWWAERRDSRDRDRDKDKETLR
jgi:hypothetical protein